MSFIRSRLLLLLLSALFTLPTYASTTLFEVSDGESRILLGGTIHLLKPSDFPLPGAFDQAYKEASAVYFETDLAAATDAEFGQLVAQKMLLPMGKTLNTELSPEVWKKVEEHSAESEFPVQQFIGFNPAFVSIVMVMVEAQRLGIGAGVDAHFYERAKADKKPTGELETKEDVLEYMEVMAAQDGNAIMLATLRDLNRMEDMMDTATAAWRKGDLAALDKQLGQPMKEESPELYKTLLIERNKQWLPKIEALFSQKGTELVLVGSLHLTGEKNLLELLKKKGYSVKVYQP